MNQKDRPASETAFSMDKLEKERPKGKDRSFISNEEIRNVVQNGVQGFLVRVRLTSYRSLPLSCIEKIELSVDGVPVNPDDITFILNGYRHKLDELAHMSHIWWFILDYADLFVASKTPLPAGEHLVEGTLVTVEPYVTGGRFSFFYPSRKRLSVEVEL